ncbi:uncharacterized protein L201_004565 [Kwoniella dendrophila CBS 6074]|uniref:Glucose-methanol-choline oxidoreductase N-terminal domain-containing protein n=1 Tax=Kwoniella dendrophila CBS 6074 TaxID=1295534 RepID=A0AAX4JYK1_9TREE
MLVTNVCPDNADIVICGGGGAGCVIATRLAEARPDLSILLLEQGPDNREATRLQRPLDSLFWLFQKNPYLKWIDCEPEVELGGRQPRIPVGNILGGGTSINTLMYNTPAASDFDDWNQPGWTYKDLEPLIRKSIKFTSPERPGSSPHSEEGIFEVSRGGHSVSYGDAHAKACRLVLGNAVETDNVTTYRNGHCFGRQPKLITVDGKRSNVADAYLHPTKAKNLIVVTGITIDKVDLTGTRATGVSVIGNIQPAAAFGKSERYARTVTANRLVILTCGTLGTPAVLERSGIGSPEVLNSAGVAVRVDLPGVGHDLDDHQLICPMYRAKEGYYEPFDEYARGVRSVKDPIDAQYDKTGKGVAASNGFDFGMKIRPTKQEIESMGPAFTKYWDRIGVNKPDKPLYSNVILPYFYSYRPPPDGKYFCIGGFHNYPASRGSVHISTSDPFALPKATTGFLSRPEDLPVHVWYYKKQREYSRRLPFYQGEEPDSHPRFDAKSPARLRDVNDLNQTDKPVAEDHIIYSAEDDKAIEQYVKENVATAYHSIGTCAMKKRENHGVVDEKLNVYGVNGLKVADLSICPSNIGSNTTSVVLLIAENAADIFLDELKEPLKNQEKVLKAKL